MIPVPLCGMLQAISNVQLYNLKIVFTCYNNLWVNVVFECTYWPTSNQGKVLPSASQLDLTCLLSTLIAAPCLYDGMLGIQFHFSPTADLHPTASSDRCLSFCTGENNNLLESKGMGSIGHIGPVHREVEFQDSHSFD